MSNMGHWIAIVLVGITFLLFFATHADETDALMQTGLKAGKGLTDTLASFATTQGQGGAHS